MAKIGGEIEFRIGEDGLIALRRPTNKEWNDFDAARYPVHRNKITNHAMEARCALFDKLCTRIETIEDDQGPITLETIERIPNRNKADMIFKAFESNAEVEEKN